MQHRGGGNVLSEVVHRAPYEDPVHDIQRGTDQVARDRSPLRARSKHPRTQRSDQQYDRCCWQQSFCATPIEARKVDRARTLDLAQQLSGDHKAGHHKEHINTDKAAWEKGEPAVVEQYEEHRHGSQAFNVSAETR